jgi:hypothetical protein
MWALSPGPLRRMQFSNSYSLHRLYSVYCNKTLTSRSQSDVDSHTMLVYFTQLYTVNLATSKLNFLIIPSVDMRSMHKSCLWKLWIRGWNLELSGTDMYIHPSQICHFTVHGTKACFRGVSILYMWQLDKRYGNDSERRGKHIKKYPHFLKRTCLDFPRLLFTRLLLFWWVTKEHFVLTYVHTVLT